MESKFISVEPKENLKGEAGYLAVCKDGYAVWYPKSSFELTNGKDITHGN